MLPDAPAYAEPEVGEGFGVQASGLRTFGGTPNRDPCSLWGLIWRLPRDIGAI